MTTWQNWKKKFKFQIWKKNCFPGLSPKPLARVNPKSRRVSNIISDIITVVLKLLKNQITAFNIYGSLPVLSWKLLVFWGLWNGGNWKKGGFFFIGFFKEPKNGSSLIIWYCYKYNQWFFFWWNFAKLWNSTAVSELHKGEKKKKKRKILPKTQSFVLGLIAFAPNAWCPLPSLVMAKSPLEHTISLHH